LSSQVRTSTCAIPRYTLSIATITFSQSAAPDGRGSSAGGVAHATERPSSAKAILLQNRNREMTVVRDRRLSSVVFATTLCDSWLISVPPQILVRGAHQNQREHPRFIVMRSTYPFQFPWSHTLFALARSSLRKCMPSMTRERLRLVDVVTNRGECGPRGC